jgi:hypothetical protein
MPPGNTQARKRFNDPANASRCPGGSGQPQIVQTGDPRRGTDMGSESARTNSYGAGRKALAAAADPVEG